MSVFLPDNWGCYLLKWIWPADFPKFGELVLGCIEADFFKWCFVLQDFSSFRIFAHFSSSRFLVALPTFAQFFLGSVSTLFSAWESNFCTVLNSTCTKICLILQNFENSAISSWRSKEGCNMSSFLQNSVRFERRLLLCMRYILTVKL